VDSGAGVTYKPFKFVVTAVCLKIDDDDQILGEIEANPVSLYGVEALVEWANSFEENLATATVAEMDGRAM
jgi:hypothetical protein